MSFRMVHRPADHHGRRRDLSDLTAIVLHETEGFNGGDYSTLKGGGGRSVSVHFWVPDYNDPGAGEWKDTIVRFLDLDQVGYSVGKARSPYDNRRTISIEMGNRESETYGGEQLRALDWLIEWIDREVGRKLPIKSHAEIALPRGRKTDPGRAFPLAAYKKWRRHEKPKAAAMAPHPWPGVVLRRGSAGADVRVVQERLRAHGSDLTADGDFGPITEAAVRSFQRDHPPLEVDGEVGPKTWSAMWGDPKEA